MELIEWNEQRQRVFLDRYAKKDDNNDPVEKGPEEMWARVASAMAETPKESQLFYEILDKFQFVPGGRILAGDRTLYNCFVLGFKPGGTGADSRGSIMSVIAKLIEITARGGGGGINWSALRPRDASIRGVNGKSSGSIAWMRGADSLEDAIIQGGTRTAALMFMLDDWHPDIVEFTQTMSRFERANFSINISRKFMEAVEKLSLIHI